MLIDLTLRITPNMLSNAQQHEKKALTGHLGTHFDVMNKEFPLEYTERTGIVFDVSQVRNRDIDCIDIDLGRISNEMFVAFYTGYLEAEGYGTKRYFTQHPQLSDALIDYLLAKGVSIIGIDFAGIRRGAQHTPKDQYCADHGVFIIENLCNLHTLATQQATFIANTYPMNYADMTGLPCRVIAKL